MQEEELQSREDSQKKLSTDRLIDAIRTDSRDLVGNGHQNTNKLDSHKIQKSEDFKITFAYTSKNSSELQNTNDFGRRNDSHVSSHQHQKSSGRAPTNSHKQSRQLVLDQ